MWNARWSSRGGLGETAAEAAVNGRIDEEEEKRNLTLGRRETRAERRKRCSAATAWNMRGVTHHRKRCHHRSERHAIAGGHRGGRDNRNEARAQYTLMDGANECGEGAKDKQRLMLGNG